MDLLISEKEPHNSININNDTSEKQINQSLQSLSHVQKGDNNKTTVESSGSSADDLSCKKVKFGKQVNWSSQPEESRTDLSYSLSSTKYTCTRTMDIIYRFQ